MRILRFLSSRTVVLLILLAALCAQAGERLPFGTWRRVADTPVISPRGTGGKRAEPCNPAVMVRDGKIVMLYREQDQQGTSRLAHANGEDGIHFNRRDE